MKHDEFVGFRIPNELRSALERKRQKMSRAAGAEVKTSAVIRALLTKSLRDEMKLAAKRPQGAAA